MPELFYLDDAGNKQDSSLHGELLGSEEAEAFSAALGLLQAYEVLGSDEGLENLYGMTLPEARAIVGVNESP